MSDQARFPDELTAFLFEYAEEVALSFPEANAIPVNLSIAYFESIVYLTARVRVLLPYFQISETLVSDVRLSVRERLTEEFRNADPELLGYHTDLATDEYDRICRRNAPFSEQWYHQLFEVFRRRMCDSLSTSRRYIWNLEIDPDRTEENDDEQLLEFVHRAEIHQVVPFQRLVINFFNYQME